MKLKFNFKLKFKCFFLFQFWIIFATWSLSLIFENLRDFLRSFSMGTLQLLKTDEKIGILNPKTWKIELIDPERNFLGRRWLWGYFEHRNAEVKFYAFRKLIWFRAELGRAPLSGQESSPGTRSAARVLIVIFDIFLQPENKIITVGSFIRYKKEPGIRYKKGSSIRYNHPFFGKFWWG